MQKVTFCLLVPSVAQAFASQLCRPDESSSPGCFGMLIMFVVWELSKRTGCFDEERLRMAGEMASKDPDIASDAKGQMAQATFLVLAWEAIARAKEQRAKRPLATLAADVVEEASASIALPATLWAVSEDDADCEDPAESFCSGSRRLASRISVTSERAGLGFV